MRLQSSKHSIFSTIFHSSPWTDFAKPQAISKVILPNKLPLESWGTVWIPPTRPPPSSEPGETTAVPFVTTPMRETDCAADLQGVPHDAGSPVFGCNYQGKPCLVCRRICAVLLTSISACQSFRQSHQCFFASANIAGCITRAWTPHWLCHRSLIRLLRLVLPETVHKPNPGWIGRSGETPERNKGLKGDDAFPTTLGRRNASARRKYIRFIFIAFPAKVFPPRTRPRGGSRTASHWEQLMRINARDYQLALRVLRQPKRQFNDSL